MVTLRLPLMMLHSRMSQGPSNSAPIGHFCSYVVSVDVGGESLPGWPKAMEVVPAGSGPVKAVVRGSALQEPLLCGAPTTLTLATSDRFGNPR